MLIQKTHRRSRSLTLLEVVLVSAILDSLLIFMSSFWLIFAQIILHLRKGLGIVLRERLQLANAFWRVQHLLREGDETVTKKVQDWVGTFYSSKHKNLQICYRVSKSADTCELLEEIVQETKLLEENPLIPSKILIVNSVKYFSDPERFNRWLNVLTEMRKRSSQITLAYFHPNSHGKCWECLHGTPNGSCFCSAFAPPFPIIHVTRTPVF